MTDTEKALDEARALVFQRARYKDLPHSVFGASVDALIAAARADADAEIARIRHDVETMAEDNDGARAEIARLREALVEVLIPLEVLHMAAMWELAPEVKVAVARAVDSGRAALAGHSGGATGGDVS